MRRFGAFATLLFVLIALYAPFLRSHLPLALVFDGKLYFPLIASLLSPIEFPSLLERFWNFTALFLPVALIIWFFTKRVWCLAIGAIVLYFGMYQSSLDENVKSAFLYLRDVNYDTQVAQEISDKEIIRTPRRRYLDSLQDNQAGSWQQKKLLERDQWLQAQAKKISFIAWPPFGVMSWFEDVGGSAEQNEQVSFGLMTRRNRQDLASALLFGLRVSLFVGAATFCLSFAFAVPLGLLSGYFGGWFDLFLCRFVEIWESLPQFLTLLLIITFFETKTIFLVVALLALFGWTMLFRYIRAEVLRERKLSYIECLELYGLPRIRILFRHLLPNVIYPVLALAPFEIMAAITRESALSFLGLGDERICSLGILMDEGRISFPQESVLLWPPAIVLTLLLIAIAFWGEDIRRSFSVRKET